MQGAKQGLILVDGNVERIVVVRSVRRVAMMVYEQWWDDDKNLGLGESCAVDGDRRDKGHFG